MRKKTKRKNHKFFKAVLVCFVILSLIGLRYFYLKSGSLRPTSRAISGTICTKSMDLLSQNKAKIKKIYVKQNDVVRKGDKLADLDTSIIDAKINRVKAKIAYEKEKANYFKLNEEKSLEEYLNAKKDSSLDIKETNGKLSHLEKSQLLYKIEKSKIDLLDTENAYLKVKKQKSAIFSPKNGQIVDINVFQDKFINTKEKLFTISDSENIWVDVKVNKSDLSKYKLGDRFDFEITDFSDARFQGKVFDIAQIEDEDGFINLKLSINQIKENPSEKTYPLQSGMTANFLHE